MLMTLARACDQDFANYDLKKLIDDRTILRRETGEDFLTPGDNGRLALDIDDAAVLCGYADLRRVGYPVKLAGLIMSRIRTAMQANPGVAQLVTVSLQNGFSFTMSSEDISLTSGYSAGGYITTALLFDARNYRERVQRAIEAFEPDGEVDDAAA